MHLLLISNSSKSITSSFGFPKDSAKKLWCLLKSIFEIINIIWINKSRSYTKPSRVLLSILYVPPYRLFDATIWSPDFNKVIKVVAIAEVPEAVATAATPPSTAANLCSKTSLVGLLSLV